MLGLGLEFSGIQSNCLVNGSIDYFQKSMNCRANQMRVLFGLWRVPPPAQRVVKNEEQKRKHKEKDGQLCKGESLVWVRMYGPARARHGSENRDTRTNTRKHTKKHTHSLTHARTHAHTRAHARTHAPRHPAGLRERCRCSPRTEMRSYL